jgi:group I intron endonuclease
MNSVNGKLYVGKTKYSIEFRWKKHVTYAKLKRYNMPLHKAIVKYGESRFKLCIISSAVTNKEANSKEKYFISLLDTFKNGYNATTGGEGRPNRPLSKSITDSIIHKYKSGCSYREISSEFHVDNKRIKQILLEGNTAPRKRSSKLPYRGKGIDPLSVKELSDKGLSTRQIAKILSINQKSAWKILHKLNKNINQLEGQ